MKDLGYPQDAVALTWNIYSQFTTTYIREYFGKIQPLPIQRGNIQGTTLSPYLFIIFLDSLLRLQRGIHGYTYKTSTTELKSATYFAIIRMGHSNHQTDEQWTMEKGNTWLRHLQPFQKFKKYRNYSNHIATSPPPQTEATNTHKCGNKKVNYCHKQFQLCKMVFTF